MRYSALSLILVAWVTCNSPFTTAGELDPSQVEWHKKYKKQDNAPKPAEMLLNTDTEPALDDGFRPLFDGKTLNGWETKGGKCKFEVRDGCIVATCVPGEPSTYLCTQQKFSDFVFTCEMKWEVDCNSGVMFRASAKPGKKSETVFGPQAEMEGFARDRGWSGGIYGQSCGGYFYPLWLREHAKARRALKKDGWNRITIKTEGKNVKTWLNGTPAANWNDDGTYGTGFFGLQMHKGSAGTVWFRDLKVAEQK